MSRLEALPNKRLLRTAVRFEVAAGESGQSYALNFGFDLDFGRAQGDKT